MARAEAGRGRWDEPGSRGHGVLVVGGRVVSQLPKGQERPGACPGPRRREGCAEATVCPTTTSADAGTRQAVKRTLGGNHASCAGSDGRTDGKDHTRRQIRGASTAAPVPDAAGVPGTRAPRGRAHGRPRLNPRLEDTEPKAGGERRAPTWHSSPKRTLL